MKNDMDQCVLTHKKKKKKKNNKWIYRKQPCQGVRAEAAPPLFEKCIKSNTEMLSNKTKISEALFDS